MIDEHYAARIRWRCRRGMLELDILLEQFFDNHFHQLNEQQRQDFERLLETPDQTLNTWFLGQADPQDQSLKQIVDMIRNKE